MRVMIVDDGAPALAGLLQLLERARDIQVIAASEAPVRIVARPEPIVVWTAPKVESHWLDEPWRRQGKRKGRRRP